MKKTGWLILLSTIVTGVGTAFATEPGSSAQYLWTKETNVQSLFKAQMGAGKLDSRVAHGAIITNYFGVDFAASPDLQISLGLPLAGTASDRNDDYGIGNIVIGGKYVVPMDRLQVALGLDLALPSSQNGSAIGVATRQYSLFTKDQTAISPYLAATWVGDKVTLSGDFGTDLQIFNKDSAGRDNIEDVLFYDAAVAHSFYENLWATVEFGGYSSISYGNGNTTQLFAGPGFRYQDHELSVGVHLQAPFRRPMRDLVDFLVAFDLRVYF